MQPTVARLLTLAIWVNVLADPVTLPEAFCEDTLYHSRKRQLHAEEYSNITCSQEPVYGTTASGEIQAIESELLDADQLQELHNLIFAHKDQVSWTPDDIGEVSQAFSDLFLRNPTEKGASCKQKPYRLSYKELDVFREQIKLLIEKGVIKKADGPTDFLSPVMFVPKPRQPDLLRMCVHFRRLNKVSKRDYHALPHVRDLLNDMSGSKYFTALDLKWGFWALPIVEDDQHKTAFAGPDGEVYVWKKAPMGLTNSPAAFQRLKAHVLQGIPRVLLYIPSFL